jgi:hypothetical protein
MQQGFNHIRRSLFGLEYVLRVRCRKTQTTKTILK